MASWSPPRWVPRAVAGLLALLGIPLVLSVSSVFQDAPVRTGEPSPRTVVAPDLIRVTDPDATERARREAADGVEPVTVDDDEAKAAIVERVRDAFVAAEAVREPGAGEARPTRSEQIDALRERVAPLDDAGLARLVTLTDRQLDQVGAEAIQIAQQLARQSIPEDRVEQVTDRTLQTELAVRPFPEGVADQVVAPLIRDAVRPTVREDVGETAALREERASEVADVTRTFTRGGVIVQAGEVVDDVQMAALRTRGLEGTNPWQAFLRLLALTLIVAFAVIAYLRAYRQQIWKSSRRVLLLSVLLFLFALSLEAVNFAVPSGASTWLFILPVGAVAMLATILFDPPIGVLVTIPVTALVAFTVSGEPALVIFAAVASLGSVPLVSRLSARGDLRSAAWKSTLGYVALAAVCAATFGNLESVPLAAAAGAVNGVLTAVIVNGSLPFLESVFGILTATSLLDLADRNHPLLRELEQKALGSYNHSIMVSTLVERACRAIDADALLASVGALYHDIGKVRRPYFFVENQFGIPNPHDELEPHTSATIIKEHVSDGIEMGRAHRLPPEVIAAIATHHGTTLVTYFYRRALEQARQPHEVDEPHYRYPGPKPSSKEMAVLMLADSCEGASRAAALTNRNLSRHDLEGIVRSLVAERVEDGQLEDTSLTFRELAIVQDSFIETLVGVYHPRIAYPKKQGDREGTAAEESTTPPDDAPAPDPAEVNP